MGRHTHETHNKTAMQAAEVIISQSKGDSKHAMVVLESVIVGVLIYYFQNHPDRFRISSETLDLITEAALRRLK